MRITLENLGIFKKTEFHIKDFTIICGGNNTGKTYAVYAYYGFIRNWKRLIKVDSQESNCEELIDSGVIKVDIKAFIEKVPAILQKASKEYKKILHIIFGAKESLFNETLVHIGIDPKQIDLTPSFRSTFHVKGKVMLELEKKNDDTILFVTLLQKNKEKIPPLSVLENILNETIARILFYSLFSKPFIASAERTGAAIFRNELDFARNRMLDEIGRSSRNINPFEIVENAYKSYAMPIQDNVDFLRNLESISNQESFILKEHGEIISLFEDIVGGQYRVIRNELFFIPKKDKRIRLSMDESSSSVRSLLDIGFYLKHLAEKNSMLLVDEPELNLHPQNQRKIARLFAKLINLGIKIFITTHSDYLIKEINTLLMLKHSGSQEELLKKHKYSHDELLKPEQLAVYRAGESLIKEDKAQRRRRTRVMTILPCDIDPGTGIEIKDFDDAIIEMNEIQEDILLAE